MGQESKSALLKPVVVVVVVAIASGFFVVVVVAANCVGVVKAFLMLLLQPFLSMVLKMKSFLLL